MIFHKKKNPPQIKLSFYKYNQKDQRLQLPPDSPLPVLLVYLYFSFWFCDERYFVNTDLLTDFNSELIVRRRKKQKKKKKTDMFLNDALPS